MSSSMKKTTKKAVFLKKKTKGPGPFVPKVHLPRALPPTSEKTSKTQLVSNAGEQGLLQQVGREADEALAIGKRVLGMLNVENKNLSFSTVSVSTDYSGLTYNPLGSITQGDTDSQRDGDSLKLKGWKGKLLFTRGGTDSIVAYAFVQEGPTFITALQQVFEGAGTLLAPVSQPLWDSRLGFKVLSMHCRALTQDDPFWIIPFDHHFNHDVQYYNNSTTVYEGKVSLIVISGYTGGAPPTISFDSQMRWIDN